MGPHMNAYHKASPLVFWNLQRPQLDCQLLDLNGIKLDYNAGRLVAGAFGPAQQSRDGPAAHRPGTAGVRAVDGGRISQRRSAGDGDQARCAGRHAYGSLVPAGAGGRLGQGAFHAG
jgi:hypothetical protein